MRTISIRGMRNGWNDATHRLQNMERTTGSIFIFEIGRRTNIDSAKYYKDQNKIQNFALISRLSFINHTGHPNTAREKRNGRNALSAAGLRFEILVAHSKWRITYNGWLRVQKANAPFNNMADAGDDEFQHVVFSFL